LSVVRTAKALSDPLRFSILKKIAMANPCCSLSGEEPSSGVCVCELVDGMGLLQSKVSYHIKELKDAGLIIEETRGRWNYYSLKPGALEKYVEALKGELQV
jgi:ArsR family transcriptional regulator, arsenate/arsenite/antimonite-responsive transcriptional repressor